MADRTEIAWCDSTFNPWIGCTKVGPGCDHCYAEADMDIRRHRVRWGAGQERSRTSAAYWQQPYRWARAMFAECVGCGWRGDVRAPDERGSGLTPRGRCPACDGAMFKEARRRVFCASLADVFDNEVDPTWRAELFALIACTPNLDWLLLTKRIGNAERMIAEAVAAARSNVANSWDLPPWPWPNVWLGATVVDQVEADRDVPKLLATPAAVRFLSIEPMLGPIDLRHVMRYRNPGLNIDALTGWSTRGQLGMASNECSIGVTCSHEFPRVDWVVVGGESGPGARPMHPTWARSLRNQCGDAGVPFLFKQWGEWGPGFNEDHFTHGGAESRAHAWIDGKSSAWGLCWIFDDDGSWSNWTGDPPTAGDGEVLEHVAVMGRFGKKHSGRRLDGREHHEFPEPRA